MQNVKDAIEHLKNHQKYPATKAQLVAACNGLSDFSEKDKKEFSDNLRHETYDSAQAVMNDLGLEEK